MKVGAVTPMPAKRREALEEIRGRLLKAKSVVVTTHVGPDGDGIGSATALGSWLDRHGVESSLVVPSPAPSSLHFITGGHPPLVPQDPTSVDVMNRAHAFAVLDTDEGSRLGAIMPHIERVGGILIDHHVPHGQPLLEPALRDGAASATGELIFDLISLYGGHPTLPEAAALYVAIVTDTGSFSFSNTTTRVHQIAATLLDIGVNPEEMYRRLYGTLSRGRLSLIQATLASLEADPRMPVAWVSLDHEALSRVGATSEDVDGLVEYPRRLQGVEVALAFRGLTRDRTKVSLRSNGDTDVAAIARDLGGGGHPKASGVIVESALPDAVRLLLDEFARVFAV